MITGIRAGRHYFSASPTIQPTQHSKGEQSSLHRHMCSNCEEKQKETQSALVYQCSVLQVIRPSMTQVCVVCKRPPPSANHLSKSIFILFDVEGKGKGAE